MPEYKYLIIGGGMTADAAVAGIREIDVSGSVGVIGSEPDPPYNRPPLTKGLWKGEPFDSIWRDAAKEGAVLHLGRAAKTLDPQRKQVTDDQNSVYSYEKLLLATGGSPRRLPFNNGDIIYYRTAADYRRLRALTEKKKAFAVIGGGFIGSELAAALAMNQKEVVLVFPGEAICSRMFPKELAAFLSDYYQKKGVQILAGETVVGCERPGGQKVLRTKGGHEIGVDAVVAGLGIEPNVALATQAGLKVENGIVVDESLRTAQTDIYAAGDVAAFYNAALGKFIRVEHEDNANTMGRLAGRNMAGTSEPYRHLPFFYSDLFDLGYEAVGELDSSLETVIDWKKPFQEGVIYYLREGRVRGVLLWNTWGQVDHARQLIAERGPHRAENLKGKLPR